MDLTIYTWGNDISLYNQLQGIKFLAQDTHYIEALVYTIAMITAYYKIVKEKSQDTLKIIFGNLIISMIFIESFVHTNSDINVVIEDEVYERASKVQEVPIGIALLKSFSSNMERDLTKWLEKGYSTPDSLNLSNTGLGFTMLSTLQTMEANTTNSDVLETFKYYFHNCLKADLINRDKTIPFLYGSGDLINDLAPAVEFETLVFNSSNPLGLEVSCSEAWNNLKGSISIEAQKFIENDLVAKMNMNSNKIAQGLSDQANLFYGVSRTGREYVEQEMIKNLLTYGQFESAKLTGGDTLQAVYSKTIAEKANYENWRLSGEQAISNLPMVRNTYDVIFIGVIPLLALLSAGTANAKFILVAVSMLLSLTLWQPLGTILNFHYISELENLAHGLQYTGDFINVYKSKEMGKEAQAKISFLMSIYTILPLLAMALFSGSGYALTRAFQAGTGTSAGVGKLAEDNSRGNVSLGDTSYNNTSTDNIRAGANDMINNGTAYSNSGGADPLSNTSTVEQTAQGTSYSLNDLYNTQKASSSFGSVTVGADGELKNVNSPHLDERISTSEKLSVGEMQERVSAEAKDFTNAVSKDISNLYSSGESRDNSKTLAERYGLNSTEAKGVDSKINEAKAQSFVSSLSTSEKDQMLKDLGVNVTAGVDSSKQLAGALLSKATGFSMSASGAYNYRDVRNEEHNESLSSDQTKQYQESLNKSISSVFSESSDLTRGMAQNVVNNESLSNTSLYKEATQYNSKVSELEQYKTSLNHTKENINSSGVSVSNLVLDEYNKLKYGNSWLNGNSHDRANMSMNSLEEMSNSNNADTQRMLNLARQNVYNAYEVRGSHGEINNNINNSNPIGIDTSLSGFDEKSQHLRQQSEISQNSIASNGANVQGDIKQGVENLKRSSVGKSEFDLLEEKIDQINKDSIFNSPQMKNTINKVKEM